MTGRFSRGGMQKLLGIEPDLTTLAKFVGGGLSFGAFGGRTDLMSRFDPSRPDALQHGGTFNNDVLTMAAGAAGLTQVLTDDEIGRLNALGDRLRDRLNAFAAERDIEFCATGYGSLVGLTSPPDRCGTRETCQSPRSFAASFTSTCSSAATRMAAAGSSLSHSPWTRTTSTASRRSSRSFWRPSEDRLRVETRSPLRVAPRWRLGLCV
jgi:glutamate-1-semialdehyde aminotransferase